MIRLSKDKVVQLHRLVAQRTGGSADILYPGILTERERWKQSGKTKMPSAIPSGRSRNLLGALWKKAPLPLTVHL